jgi:exodeoxyribonuclease V alpha subunit
VIASQVTPVTQLNEIFRQVAGSQIVINAHRINQGEIPVFSNNSRSSDSNWVLQSDHPGDFFFFSADTPEETAGWVEQVVCNRIPQKFNLNPRDQIQVLAPMYRGPVGVTALNERLQAILNPPSPSKLEKGLYGQTFRTGDKVMQIRNNYDKDVFNGDIGIVLSLDMVDHILGVDFEGHIVNYDWSDVDQLVLAYAVSVHKAQGSEFPAVVMPIVTAHYMMLQRNLLYTAITRAKQLCVLIGSKKAIGIAVHNNKVAQRYTALDWRLRSRAKG